ncbi:MAG: hypothetical protein H0X03_00295 [Nitrosopumilus sp.]|nr:hypothetical protein [Nitrosopumilus sp.]
MNENKNKIEIPLIKEPDYNNIKGNLAIPKDSRGLVIFAHGSGNGRQGQRNQFVAQVLNNDNNSTLLIDLLTEEEEQ